MSLGYTVLVLVVYVLAVARVTRLVNADAFLDPLRIVLARRARDEKASANERRRWAVVTDFLACPWCVGMWLALVGAGPVVVILAWPWWAGLPVGLACSHLVGVGAVLSVDEEIEILDAAADDGG